MSHFKMSTSRDFRINTAALQSALEQNEEDSEDGSEASEKEESSPEVNDVQRSGAFLKLI